MKLLKNETIEKNTVKLTIEVDADAFKAAIEKSYKKNAKQIAIPGFRKGKAPRAIIEKYYGKGVFLEDAVNFVCPDAYEYAVKESGIEPVDRPEMDIEKIEEDGSELVLTATVTVRPEVKVGEYKGISAEKKNYKTKVADVDAEIKAAREKNSRMINVEDRAVKKGDFTVIDFEGFVDGVAFPGGKGLDHNLEIGSGQFIPGFEEALVGAKIGVEKEINVTFPEEYHSEDLKGKDAMFKVTVKSIQVKELPEVNDDFAKDLGFDTLDEYKADIRAKLDKVNADKTAAEYEANVIKELVAKAEVEIPECMIDSAIEDMMRDFSYRLSSQGLSFEQYMQFTGTTPESFKEQNREAAIERVKSNLVISEIAKIENIEVSYDDVEAELKNMAEMYGMEVDKLKEFVKDGELESLKSELKLKKAVNLVVGAAKVKRAAKKKEDEE